MDPARAHFVSGSLLHLRQEREAEQAEPSDVQDPKKVVLASWIPVHLMFDLFLHKFIPFHSRFPRTWRAMLSVTGNTAWSIFAASSDLLTLQNSANLKTVEN